MWTRYANQHRFVEQDAEIRCHIQSAMNKKYCILIYIGKVQTIKSFNVSKKGFGSASAYLTIDKVSKIRKSTDNCYNNSNNN